MVNKLLILYKIFRVMKYQKLYFVPQCTGFLSVSLGVVSKNIHYMQYCTLVWLALKGCTTFSTVQNTSVLLHYV